MNTKGKLNAFNHNSFLQIDFKDFSLSFTKDKIDD